MPTVPVAQNRVGIASLNDAKIQPADLSGTGGEALGSGLRTVGAGMSQLAQAEHEYQMAYDEAAVKTTDTHILPQITDIRTSVTSKQGLDAVGALAPAKENLAKLRAQGIAALQTERQRKMFGDLFDRRAAAEVETLTGYTNAETIKANQLASGARASAYADDAVTNYADGDKFAASMNTGMGELKNLWSPYGESVVKEKQRQYISNVRLRVADTLRGDDPIGAAAYVEDHKADFTPDDLLKVHNALREPLEERQASADVDGLMGARTPNAVAPQAPTPSAGSGSNLSRMIVITARTESGGKERDGAGNLVTSPKGAQGKMQVMPGTNTDPGFGIRPAADNSDAERTRVGRDYLAAMMKRYNGDPAKAWAAYNGGPGRVDDAVRKNGPNWLSAMPKETRDYVATNTAALGGSGGPGQPTYAPRKDDLNALYAAIDEQKDWSFDRKKAARAELDNRVARDDALLRRQETDAERRAYDVIDKIGPDNFKSIGQLPADVVRNLSPESRLRLREQADNNAKPKALDSYGDTYLSMTQLAGYKPDEFAKMDLRTIRDKVTPGEFAQLMNAQTQIRTTPATTPKALSYGKIWGAIDRSAPDLGLDLGASKGKPNNPAARADSQAIFKLMQTDLEGRTQGKREPTDQEVQESFNRAVMTVKRVVPGWFSDKTEVLPRYKVAPGETYRVSVPNDKRDAIVAEFRRQGNANPSEADIARIYINTYGGK